MRNIANRGRSQREQAHICACSAPVAADRPPRTQSTLVLLQRILVAAYAAMRLWRDWGRGWWS